METSAFFGSANTLQNISLCCIQLTQEYNAICICSSPPQAFLKNTAYMYNFLRKHYLHNTNHPLLQAPDCRDYRHVRSNLRYLHRWKWNTVWIKHNSIPEVAILDLKKERKKEETLVYSLFKSKCYKLKSYFSVVRCSSQLEKLQFV